MAEPTPPADPSPAPAAPRHRLRRRILAIVGAAALVVLALIAIQTWQVLDAIKTIQEEVVVELPTRDPSIELGGAVNSGDKPPAITFGSPPAITFDPTQPAVTPTIGRGSSWRMIIPPAAQATTPVPTVRSLPTSVPRVVNHKTGAFVTGSSAAPPLLTAIASTATAALAGGGSVAATPTTTPTVRSLGNATPRPTVTPVPTATPTRPRPTSTAPATSTATASATPSRTATRLPTPSATPTATASPSATATASPTPTPTASATASPTATAAPSDTPAPTAPPAPTDTVAPTATVVSEDTGGGSTLDVARDIVSQAMESGDPGASEIWGGRTELNVLVLGIDRRPDGSYVNADVVMIFRIGLIDREVHVVSLPRDLLVQVPEYGWWKINGAFEIGEDLAPGDPAAGPSKMRDTIEYNFAIPIDGYVFVDFNGFRQIIDAAGGVTVDVPYDIFDPRYPVDDQTTEEIFFPAGRTTMDGTTALKYVRTRNADSDDARRQRQMQVLLALLDQGKGIGSIARADELILSLAGSAQTSFTLEEQLTLARLALLVDRSTIRMYSVAPPLVQGGTTDTGMWVYVGDPQQIALFVQGALAGTFDNATPTPLPGVAPQTGSSGGGESQSAPDPADTPTPAPTAAPAEPTAPPAEATTDPGVPPTVASIPDPPTPTT